MDDTSTKIERRYNKMLLSKSPTDRLRMASRMYDTAKKLAVSGILKERQHLDTARLRGELFVRIYGNDFSATNRERIMKAIPNMHSDTDS
jgi:hypothetical protein